MDKFCIVFKTDEQYMPSIFITEAYNKLDAIKNLIDNDNDGRLIDLINVGIPNTKGSSKKFKKICVRLGVFDENNEIDISRYNIFKNMYEDKFAEYLKQWCESCKEIRIEKITENIIM